MNTDIIDNLKSLKSNYTEALLHIAWIIIRHKNALSTRHLVFCLFELYPNEIPSIPIPEQEEKIKDFRLYYQRIRIESVIEAIEFYRSIVEYNTIPMFWDEDGTVNEDILNGSIEAKTYIFCGNMQDVKVWPNFTLSKRDDENGRPFIADSWDVCRIHQLFPEHREQVLLDAVSIKAVGEWLELYLTWNISIYPELIGGVNLVIPNPYYSSKLIHMMPSHGERTFDANRTRKQEAIESAVDSVKIDFQRRAKVDVPELKVIPFEKTYFGVSYCGEHTLITDSLTIPLAGRAEEFGFYVKAPEGVIDFEFFSGFWKGFTLDIFTGYATKEIHKPGKDETEKVDVYSHFNTSKSVEKETDIEKRFHDAEILRLRKRNVEKSGFKIFYDDHDGAEEFLQELIGRAHHSVMIVDPYYSTMELFDYAVHVSVVGMNVTIITSADHLKSKSRLSDIYEEEKEPLICDEFKTQIDHYKDWQSGELKVFIMTGDAAIHDRFLLVDDEAWFCGGSFNEVGQRLSCIIKIPDSRMIHNQITDIINSDRVKEFEPWYRNWKQERERNANQ